MNAPKIIDDRAKYAKQIPSRVVNAHKYVAIHYKGVTANATGLYGGGYGGHFDIQHDGTIHQNADISATIWAVGASGSWKYIHPFARNQNTVSIEANVLCDTAGKSIYEKGWYYTEATQEAMAQVAAWLLFEVLQYPVTAATVNTYLLRHGDITTKPCPAPYFASAGYKTNWSWDRFKTHVLAIGIADQQQKGKTYMFEVKQIKKGDKSDDVRLAQELLFANKLKGKDNKQLAVDGIFGDNTEYAAKKFQEAHKDVDGNPLAVDGIIGKKTWAVLLGV